MVIGSNGKSIKVTGTFPQGIRDTYWVEFSDGCGVEVSDYHLWSIQEENGGQSVVATIDLYVRSKLAPNSTETIRNLGEIPIVLPVHFERQEVHMDPYTVGVLLSVIDGPQSSIKFHHQDLEHYKKCLDLDGEWHYDVADSVVTLLIPNEVNARLLQYLSSKKSCLTIPPDLKLASISNRRAFLQGLLDIAPSADCSLPPLSDSLRADVIEIIQSLGGLVFHDNKCWAVHIESSFLPYLSPSKILTYSPKLMTAPKRFIRRITPLRRTKVLCISVDAPDHLYVTENVFSNSLPSSLCCSLSLLTIQSSLSLYCFLIVRQRTLNCFSTGTGTSIF